MRTAIAHLMKYVDKMHILMEHTAKTVKDYVSYAIFHINVNMFANHVHHIINSSIINVYPIY